MELQLALQTFVSTWVWMLVFRNLFFNLSPLRSKNEHAKKKRLVILILSRLYDLSYFYSYAIPQEILLNIHVLLNGNMNNSTPFCRRKVIFCQLLSAFIVMVCKEPVMHVIFIYLSWLLITSTYYNAQSKDVSFLFS